MATERSLAALLRSLQATTELQDALALLPTATSFLFLLGNPLNISLLASQLLSAPAIWDHNVDLQACRRILSVFNTAVIGLLEHEAAEDPRTPYSIQPKRIDREAWVKAVVNGADAKSPRWTHLLLIGGVLIGFEAQDRRGLSWNTRNKVESALVTAVQLALDQLNPSNAIEGYCITMVLNYTFELLSDSQRSKLNYDRLLPVLLHSVLESPEGFEGAYFLGAIDRDVVQVPDRRFRWAQASSTYHRVKSISAGPLISSLGPLSRLIAHAVENAQDPRQVSQAVDSLAHFSRTLMVQWRQNKLSEVDPSEETEFLEAESLKTTLPTLWKLLRNCLYSIVIVLRAVLGRVINDRVLAADRAAPFISMQVLHILRNLYFISSRMGPNASSQQLFITLAAVDILSQYPDLSENLLKSIKPSELGQIPSHPLERCLDLYFLNIAEHFTSVLSPTSNEELLIASALPYLASGGDNRLLEIFEAAHSVILAVFAIPNNADVTAKHLPFYIDNLFTVFPTNLSARQFRLAFKTIIQVTAPPSPLANSQPLLASILLDILRDRAIHASTAPLRQSDQSAPSPYEPTPTQSVAQPPPPPAATTPPLSEQSVLVLALIDSLPALKVEDLEEWLPLTAGLVNRVADPAMRRMCVDRFWEALSSGEMDVERAHCCVMWWSSKGGRELVLFGSEQQDEEGGHGQEVYMSGALGGGQPESKL